MDMMKQLQALPGTPQEEMWLRKRLETLSVREAIALDAAILKEPPGTRADAINRLFSLSSYDIRMAGSYEQLGEIYLCATAGLPEEAMPYVDKERIGRLYENEHPGLFVGSSFVAYPRKPPAPVYDGNGIAIPKDDGWSIKLKLASSVVPEGVWLRLPCFDGEMPGESVEVALALQELKVKSLEDCTLLEARCILPEMGDLTEQYDSVTELVCNCDYLGYVMEEQGQGEAHWMEKYAAALEYESCRTLRFALDISQNLPCYEWIPSKGLADFAANRLREEGVSDELIRSGCIDLERYAEDLLETSGYMLTKDESAYVTRNGREFIREFTAEPAPPAEHSAETAQPKQGGMTMQ